MDANTVDTITAVASFVLTLMVLSYLVGDNPLYRIAVSLFVGAAAGFAGLLAAEFLWNYWIRSVVIGAVTGGSTNVVERLVGVVPLVLPVIFGLSLLFKLSRRLAPLSNLTVAYLVGVGTAVALYGVVVGTLLPQVRAAGSVPGIGENMGGWLNGLVMAVGTVSTLLYFQFVTMRRPTGETYRPLPLRMAAVVGQGFVVVALASLYAGAILSSLTVFSGMVEGFYTQFTQFLP